MSICAGCRYYLAILVDSEDMAEDGKGECRRYAPRSIVVVDIDRCAARKPDSFTYEWPAVYSDDFCGEFQAIEEQKS